MPRKDRCDRGRALLALGITSIPNEFSRRRYIRPWFSAANQGPSSSSHWYEKVLEHRFVLGTKQMRAGQLRALQQEHAEFGDLALLAEQRETKNHLSEKSLRWFVLAAELFPCAQFVGKADPDTLLVWERLGVQLRLILSRRRALDRRVVVGTGFEAPERKAAALPEKGEDDERHPVATPQDDLVLPWTKQYEILLRRNWLAHRLDLVDPMFLFNICSITLLCALLWYGRAGTRPRTESSVEDTGGLLFLQPVYWGFQLMIQALFAFPPSRLVLTKERAAGLYSVSAFFLARTTVDSLTAALISPLFSLVYYFSAGLRPAMLPKHCLVLFMNGLAAQSSGLAIGAWVPDLKRAATFETVFMLTTMMAAGFYVSNIPAWLEWIGMLSYTKYSYGALAKTEFRGTTYNDGGVRTSVGDHSSLDAIPLRSGITGDLLALLAFTVLFRLLAFAGLKRNT